MTIICEGFKLLTETEGCVGLRTLEQESIYFAHEYNNIITQ